MARPLRTQYPGAVYHVLARGNQGRDIFADDGDRKRWLATLGEACGKTGGRIHANVLTRAALSVCGRQETNFLSIPRENQVDPVLALLEEHSENLQQTEVPVRSAHGYINERREHLDYAGALAAGLPIGSGEVESGPGQ